MEGYTKAMGLHRAYAERMYKHLSVRIRLSLQGIIRFPEYRWTLKTADRPRGRSKTNEHQLLKWQIQSCRATLKRPQKKPSTNF